MEHLYRVIFFYVFVLFSFMCGAQPYEILGIGGPCMDVLVNVDHNFVEFIGNKGGSQQIDKDQFDLIFNQAINKGSKIATGGSASNTIKGLKCFGHSCAFFGKIGRDPIGKQYQSIVKSLGITSFCLCSNQPTQLVLCLVTPDGERTMRCFPGAANTVSKADLASELFQGVKMVHIEGYMLYSEDPEFVSTAMRLAKEAGAKVSFDLSSFELVKMKREKIIDLIKNYVDIVFANSDEVFALLGLDPWKGCRALMEMCPISVVMIGKDGCLVGIENNLIHSPAYPVNVVDTTGAGDVFISGFLHGYLKGYSFEDCATLGNRTGGAVCEFYGAEIPPERWQKIIKQEFCIKNHREANRESD